MSPERVVLLNKSSSCCADRQGQDASPLGLDGMIISADGSGEAFAEQGTARQAVNANSAEHSRLGRRRCRLGGSCVSIICSAFLTD